MIAEPQGHALGAGPFDHDDVGEAADQEEVPASVVSRASAVSVPSPKSGAAARIRITAGTFPIVLLARTDSPASMPSRSRLSPRAWRWASAKAGRPVSPSAAVTTNSEANKTRRCQSTRPSIARLDRCRLTMSPPATRSAPVTCDWPVVNRTSRNAVASTP